MTHSPARTYSTREAAVMLDVPAMLIAKWKHRGVITPAGLVRGRGRGGLSPTYNLSDLQPHADAYHRRRSGDTRAHGGA